MKLLHQWCVIISQDSATNTGDSIVESAFGPFNKADARKFADEFNSEYDGSPWCAIVRPLTRFDAAVSD
jgi:hypothetical protein